MSLQALMALLGHIKHVTPQMTIRYATLASPALRTAYDETMGKMRRQFTLTPAGRPIIPDKVSWLNSEMLKTRVAHDTAPGTRPPAHAPTRTSARPATTMSPALNSPTPSAVTALRPQRLSSRSSPDPTEGDSLMRRRSNRRRRCNNTLYFDVQ